MAEFEEDYVEVDEFEDDEDDEDYETEEEDEYTEGEDEGSEDVIEDDANNAQDWSGRTSLPAGTWEQLAKIVSRMSEERRNTLTVLVIGRPLTGRSSTVNTVLCEPAAAVGVLRGEAPSNAEVYVRSVGGFMLKVVDTPRLLVGDRVNTEAFRDIAAGLGTRKVDVVMYVDRLDSYRIDPLDKQLFEAITNHFGAAIWNRTVITLTGGSISPPRDYTFESFTTKRASQLRDAMRAAGAGKAALPFAVVENHSRCKTSPEGDRLLPDDRPQLPVLMETLVDTALDAGSATSLKFRPYNPNRRRLWLIPFLLAAQWAVKKYLIDPAVEADGWRGDRHGTYSAEVQLEEQRLMKLRKSEAKAEDEKLKRFERAAKASEERQGTALASQTAKSGLKKVVYQDDLDDDEDYDDED